MEKLVFIADPHPIIGRGIRGLFKNSPDVIFRHDLHTYTQLEDALTLEKPELIILDINLTELNGIQGLRELTNNFPDPEYLIFTDTTNALYQSNCEKCGVNYFFTKDYPYKKLRQSIRRILKGQQPDEVENPAETIYEKLSEREIEVLKLLMQGYRNKTIANLLSLNQKTVSTYKTRSFKKLGIRSSAQIASRLTFLMDD